MRIKKLREEKNMSKTALAAIAGLSGQGIADIEEGTSKDPRYQSLLKIAEHFQVNLNWLLTGKGNISNATPPTHQIPTKHNGGVPAVVTVDSEGRENVPLVPIRARAGYLRGYDDPEFLGTLPTYRLPGISNGTFRMFEVEGHSMNPTLKSRDIVIAEWVEDPAHMRDERIYIIVTQSDGIVIKRCVNRIQKYGFILAKSDNANKQEYPDFEIQPVYKGEENIKEIWYARLLISPYFPAPADLYNRMTSLEVEMANMRKLLNG